MKVLSMLQPWASLVVMGVKKYELRNWKTLHRGEILIHASSKKPAREEKKYFEQGDYFKNYIQNTDLLPYGAIIGKTSLTDIFQTEWLMQNLEIDPWANWKQEFVFDDFSPNRFAWKFEEAQKFDRIIPVKGMLGLWEYKNEL